MFLIIDLLVRIIGEPGRYFCSGSSTLAVVVNSKRKKKLVPAIPSLDEHHDQHDHDHEHEDVIVEDVRAAFFLFFLQF